MKPIDVVFMRKVPKKPGDWESVMVWNLHTGAVPAPGDEVLVLEDGVHIVHRITRRLWGPAGDDPTNGPVAVTLYVTKRAKKLP